MKLGKLLAAGKSIMNGRVEVSYRASKQVYLPKFGPAKNPFKNGDGAPSAEAPGETSKDTPVEIPTDAPLPAPVLSSTIEPAMPRPTRAAPKTEKIPVFTAPREKKGNWAGKAISIFRAAPAAQPGGAAKAEAPAAMQTELSLDAVRVIHNDLSDVDVEIVPIKSRTAPAETKKKSWEVLGERLFGVEAT